MGLFIIFFIKIGCILVFFVVLSRVIYLQTLRGLGQEAADRNIRYMRPRLLVSLLLGFLASFFLVIAVPLLARGWNLTPLVVRWWEYTGSGSFLLYGPAVIVLFFIGIGLLSWPLRKRKAGSLLLDAGRTWHNKQLLRGGKVGIVSAIPTTLIVFVANVSLPASLRQQEIYHQALVLAVVWAVPAFAISLGLMTKLELRENGICLVCMFISWRRITSYEWERSKPNTLTIRFPPLLPLSPGFMSIAIPSQHRDEVNRIVQTHVSVSSSSDAA